MLHPNLIRMKLAPTFNTHHSISKSQMLQGSLIPTNATVTLPLLKQKILPFDRARLTPFSFMFIASSVFSPHVANYEATNLLSQQGVVQAGALCWREYYVKTTVYSLCNFQIRQWLLLHTPLIYIRKYFKSSSLMVSLKKIDDRNGGYLLV